MFDVSIWNYMSLYCCAIFALISMYSQLAYLNAILNSIPGHAINVRVSQIARNIQLYDGSNYQQYIL